MEETKDDTNSKKPERNLSFRENYKPEASVKSDGESVAKTSGNGSVKIVTAFSDQDIDGFSEDIEIEQNSIALQALENVKNNANSKVFGLFSSRTGPVSPVANDVRISKERFSYIEHVDTNPFMTKTVQKEKSAIPFVPSSYATSADIASSQRSGSPPIPVNLVRDDKKLAPPVGPKVEGREIKQDHDLYALTYGMMLGIRVMLRRVEFELRAEREAVKAKLLDDKTDDEEHILELFPEDYKYDLELNFPPEGSTISTSDTPLYRTVSGKPMKSVSYLNRAISPGLHGTPSVDSAMNRPQSITPPHKLPQAFRFKDYMSKAFRVVRGLAGIDEGHYMRSVAGDFNYIEFIANSKSGQFFFYSHDGKYMIKTQTKEESKFLRRIMPAYVAHIFQHPNSLLVRFFGMHRVKMDFLSTSTTIHFIIMSSVFDTDKPIHIKYDLKGSTVGRITKDEDCKMGAVQKDLNLVRSARKFRFTEANMDIFKSTIESDSSFLASLNIMDYSLLVGVHESANLRPAVRRPSGVQISERAMLANASHNHPPSLRNPDESIFQSFHGGIRSSPEVGEIYYLGIIDILQAYNMGKRGETMLKSIYQNGKQISSVHPKYYAKRFVEFLLGHTNYQEIKDRSTTALAPMIRSSLEGIPERPRFGSNGGMNGVNNPLKDQAKTALPSSVGASKRKQSQDGNHQLVINLQKDITSSAGSYSTTLLSDSKDNSFDSQKDQPVQRSSSGGGTTTANTTTTSNLSIGGGRASDGTPLETVQEDELVEASASSGTNIKLETSQSKVSAVDKSKPIETSSKKKLNDSNKKNKSNISLLGRLFGMGEKVNEAF